MMQNIIIIDDGIALFNKNFGECHKLDSNPILLAAFFDAMFKFAAEFDQGISEQMKFKNSNINYLKENKMLFIVISDPKDNANVIQSKLNKIAELFNERYHNVLPNYNGEISLFNDFSNLLELKIAEKNCGEHLDCKDCPNRISTSNAMNDIMGEIEKG